ELVNSEKPRSPPSAIGLARLSKAHRVVSVDDTAFLEPQTKRVSSSGNISALSLGSKRAENAFYLCPGHPNKARLAQPVIIKQPQEVLLPPLKVFGPSNNCFPTLLNEL